MLSIPAVPHIPGQPTAFAFLVKGKLTLVDAGFIHTGADAVAVIARNWSDWRTPNIRLVVASPAVTAFLSNQPSIGQRIKALAALPASCHFVDLASALGRKHPKARGKDINWWVKKLGLQGQPEVVMYELLEHVEQGLFSGPQLDLVERMMKAESDIVQGTDAYRQFASAMYVADAWTAMECSDPGGRESFKRDGTVVDATVESVDSMIITVTSKQSIKTKSGKRLIALSPDFGYPGLIDDTLSILSVTVDAKGVYTMKLLASRPIKGLTTGTPVTFMEAPFLSKTFVRPSKWSNDQPQPVRRELPQCLESEL